MGDGALSPNISDSAIDFDLIHELLSDGFWLEATDASTDFNHHQQQYFSKATAKSIFFSHRAVTYPKMDESSSHSHGKQAATFVDEESQVTARLWVGPRHDQSVKTRLVQAINFLKESIRDKDVLVQIWIPVKKQGKQVLTASNQPFSLNPSCKNLASYRDASLTYQFVADESCTEFVGLLGRVFLHRLPEWTPDVRFFRREEYPRVTHAQECNVGGSLALPVLEHGSGICLGVLEIVTTHQKLDFHPELQNVCKALEAVDLKSSNILSPYNIVEHDDSYQATLAEIRNAMKFACNAYKMPLAQVWASCLHQRRGGCRHSDENYVHCVSTIDSACYVADARVNRFHEACSHHHLLKGQGVAGKAFLTNQSCFAEDITAFSKTEYPLAHHARVFDLCACAAVRLRSICNETRDFVLEFFLPLDCKSARDQMLMLHSSSVIQEMCRSMRVITDEELIHETSGSTSAGKQDEEKQQHKLLSPSKNSSHEGGSISFNDKRDGKFKANSGFDLHHLPASLEQSQFQQDSGPRTSVESFTLGNNSYGAKASIRKQKRSDKIISLEVIRQHFAGSLKEAAKSIGVCPTTLKRICRYHGITRWPSRKIKKVGHSLRKLQLVIDSVQDGEGPIQLSSFYSNFPHLVSPNVAGTSNHLSTIKTSGDFQQEKNPAEGNLLTAATTSSSSGSQTSSSSYCCSTGSKQSSFHVNGFMPVDALSMEQNGGVLKKARSDAELHGKGQEKTKLMIKSYSHKLLCEDPVVNGASAVPVHSSRENDEAAFRVRVSFGEEKIRLSLQPHWDFKHLREEVLARFSIENVAGVNLKYLDDDAEWVLLTCDDDLEECRDIHRSSKSPTIKLSVIRTCHPNLGSSFGSDGPY
ncbi:protein NLP2-like [Salvia splendens]|uniref:protein NLP2-like n=1 Tax=Salvia splendens TaxID=180675 RepID=UPI001C25607E|nr:protein NLP2-like [Salvia splendens]